MFQVNPDSHSIMRVLPDFPGAVCSIAISKADTYWKSKNIQYLPKIIEFFIDSHLIEIFSQEQQDFIVMKAYETELLTGSGRNWWIGMTDANSEGRWFWIHSLKAAEYTSWGTRNPDGVSVMWPDFPQLWKFRKILIQNFY